MMAKNNKTKRTTIRRTVRSMQKVVDSLSVASGWLYEFRDGYGESALLASVADHLQDARYEVEEAMCALLERYDVDDDLLWELHQHKT